MSGRDQIANLVKDSSLMPNNKSFNFVTGSAEFDLVS